MQSKDLQPSLSGAVSSGAPCFDLQAHSTYSDGELSPTGVVQAAAAAGIRLLALTDHDTVSGIDEALQAGIRESVQIIPAIELSAIDGVHEELHLLGYGIDHRDLAFNVALTHLRADREQRVATMAERLRAAGFALDDDELNDRRAADEPLGRPHLAKALMSHPANAERLAYARITSVGELFACYLVPGTATYVPRSRPTVTEGIDLIHSTGGLAVWAHPFWDIADADEVARTAQRFVHAGLDGLEAFYPKHDQGQVDLLCTLADELQLLTTGSSDFHGHNHETFAAFGAFELHGHTPRLGLLGSGADPPEEDAPSANA